MLSDYRTWLAAELKLLANSSHHAYAFGQANMAKRALERFDAERSGKLVIELERPHAQAVLLAIERIGQETTAEAPALGALRDAITSAFSEAATPVAEDHEPIDTGTSG
jgi:hypothetical protein